MVGKRNSGYIEWGLLGKDMDNRGVLDEEMIEMTRGSQKPLLSSKLYHHRNPTTTKTSVGTQFPAHREKIRLVLPPRQKIQLSSHTKPNPSEDNPQSSFQKKKKNHRFE